MKLEELIDKYIKLRDLVSDMEAEHKAKIARAKSAMEKIETQLLNTLNETGQESARTKAGTAFKSISTSARVVDRDAYISFVREGGYWSMLESRISKKSAEEWLNTTGSPPPGVDITRRYTVNIRRS